MKQCPKCNRSYADDTYNFCLEDGARLMSAYDPNATWVTDKSPAHQLSTTVPFLETDGPVEIDQPVVAICINQQFPYCKTAEELYQCTRSLWRLNKARANRARYAFAVYQGIVKEVYEITKWRDGTRESSKFWFDRLQGQGRKTKPFEHVGRSEFDGKIARDEVRKKYLGRLIPERHRGNPILYFNCDL